MWEQKESFLKQVIPQDFGPMILWWEWWLVHGPELAVEMMDNGDVGASGWSTGATAAEKVNLVAGIDPAAQTERQVQVVQGGWRTVEPPITFKPPPSSFMLESCS